MLRSDAVLSEHSAWSCPSDNDALSHVTFHLDNQEEHHQHHITELPSMSLMWQACASNITSAQWHRHSCRGTEHALHTWNVSDGALLGDGEDAICTAGSSIESSPQLGWLFLVLSPSRCHTAICRSPSEAERACLPSGEKAIARTGSCTQADKDQCKIAAPFPLSSPALQLLTASRE